MSKPKICKDCGKPRGHNLMYSRCKKCQMEFEYSKPKKRYELKKTKPKAFGKKRLDRIKKQGSEYKVFVEIWLDRKDLEGKRFCEHCGKQIKFFHTSCFAHKLNKRDHPKLRYDKNNIALVHGVFEVMNEKTGETYDCHKLYDLEYKKEKFIN